ncbi:MAG: hypothetical protein WCG47_09745 [Dermatophilaceae bacterium]
MHATLLRIEGTANQLPGPISLTRYRGAEEALTNVARHAHEADATVVLRHEPTQVTLGVIIRITH